MKLSNASLLPGLLTRAVARAWSRVALVAFIATFAACAETEPASAPAEDETTPEIDDGGVVPVDENRVPDVDTGEDCESTRDYFAKRVYTPVIQGRCDGCHSSTGLAKESKLVLQPPTIEGFLDHNYEVISDIAASNPVAHRIAERAYRQVLERSSESDFAADALEDVVDEGVHDGHAALGDAGLGVHLLEHLVDVGGVALHALLVLLGALAGFLRRLGALLGGSLGHGCWWWSSIRL